MSPNFTLGTHNWFALRVRPRFEKQVARLLDESAISAFLPLSRERRRWAQRWQTVEAPLFPGYVFCSFDRNDWSRVMRVPGVVDAVRFGKQLATVEPTELLSLYVAMEQNCDLKVVLDVPRSSGERIRIAQGPLAGVEGVVLEDCGRTELILSVTLLQRSVRAVVPREYLEAAPAVMPLASLARSLAEVELQPCR